MGFVTGKTLEDIGIAFTGFVISNMMTYVIVNLFGITTVNGSTLSAIGMIILAVLTGFFQVRTGYLVFFGVVLLLNGLADFVIQKLT